MRTVCKIFWHACRLAAWTLASQHQRFGAGADFSYQFTVTLVAPIRPKGKACGNVQGNSAETYTNGKFKNRPLPHLLAHQARKSSRRFATGRPSAEAGGRRTPSSARWGVKDTNFRALFDLPYIFRTRQRCRNESASGHRPTAHRKSDTAGGEEILKKGNHLRLQFTEQLWLDNTNKVN